jgi:hypothetical protein
MANAVTENLMGRLNAAWVAQFKKLRSHEHRVAWVRNYPIQTGEDEAIIQLLIDKLDPAVPSVTRVSHVREEMQKDEAKGDKALYRLDTPEGEAYWQEKLDVAAKLDSEDREAEKKRRHDEIRRLFPDLMAEDEISTTKPRNASIPSISVNVGTGEATVPGDEKKTPQAPTAGENKIDLMNVPGFGKDTINKFIDNGITCKEQLFNLTYSQALAIARTPLATKGQRQIQD